MSFDLVTHKIMVSQGLPRFFTVSFTVARGPTNYYQRRNHRRCVIILWTKMQQNFNGQSQEKIYRKPAWFIDPLH